MYKRQVLYRGADILILDEPTAVLTPQETEKLFLVLRKMRDDGKAIIIVTHKMHEVESLSDRVAVLRDGRYIGSMATKDTTVTEMTNMMVGHAVTLNIARPDPVNPKPRIVVKDLSVRSEEMCIRDRIFAFFLRRFFWIILDIPLGNNHIFPLLGAVHELVRPGHGFLDIAAIEHDAADADRHL